MTNIGPRGQAWWGVVAASAIALGLASYAGVQGRGGVAGALHVGAAIVVLFLITGFGPTRLLLPAELRRNEALWVLPVGGIATCLEMALLVYAFIPYMPALIVVVAGNVALDAWVLLRGRRRHGATPAPADTAAPPETADHAATAPAPPRLSWRAAAVPIYLAVLIGAIALLPMFRGGFVTVIGSGSDAHLAVGTAQFLQGHGPHDFAPAEPVDQVPLVWRSKPPIYEVFAAVATLSGTEPYGVIATLQAALLALAALGFWLLASELLGAGLWGAALAMGLVGLNRMVLHTGMHPYYNQTWGYFAMPFAIVLAWHVVQRRSWPGFALLGMFLVVLAFAYPLALPIPLLAAVVFWGVDRRQRGLTLIPRPRRGFGRKQMLWLIPIFLVLLFPLAGVLEKLRTSVRVLLPGGNLINWGGDLTNFFPERYFVGLDDPIMAAIGMPLLALGLYIALKRAPRDARLGLTAVMVFGVVAALYFRPRAYGWYFHFKALAYIGPIVVTAAAVGLTKLKLRWLSIVALVIVVAASRNGAAHEIGTTFDQLPKSLLALKQVDKLLPPGKSVRLDIVADGRQLWAGYMMSGQPLCSQRPLLHTSYPHVAISRAADYVLVDKTWLKPFDAIGPPVLKLENYTLYKLRPGLPGGDHCSQRMVQTVSLIA